MPRENVFDFEIRNFNALFQIFIFSDSLLKPGKSRVSAIRTFLKKSEEEPGKKEEPTVRTFLKKVLENRENMHPRRYAFLFRQTVMHM
jgi:ribosomal protein S20